MTATAVQYYAVAAEKPLSAAIVLAVVVAVAKPPRQVKLWLLSGLGAPHGELVGPGLSCAAVHPSTFAAAELQALC